MQAPETHVDHGSAKTSETDSYKDKSLYAMVRLILHYHQSELDISTYPLNDRTLLVLLPFLTSHRHISSIKLGDLSSLTDKGRQRFRDQLSKNKTISKLIVTGTPSQVIVHTLLMGSIEANIHFRISVNTSQCIKEYQKKAATTFEIIETIKTTEKCISKQNEVHNSQSSLPEETLLRILSHLPPIALARVGQVNSIFYAISRDEGLLLNICQAYYPGPSNSLSKAAHQTWLEEFQLLHFLQVNARKYVKTTNDFFSSPQFTSNETVFFTPEGNPDWSTTFAQLKFPKDTNKVPQQKYKYLKLAIVCDTLPMVYLLLKNRAPTTLADIQEPKGGTPLNLAIPRNGTIYVKLLLKHGANPNIRDEQGDTALLWTYRMGGSRIDCTKLLLEHGANPNCKNLLGETALHLAAKGYSCGLKLLLEYGIDPDLRSSTDEPVLHVAEVCKYSNNVKLLLKYGANPDLSNRYKADIKEQYQLFSSRCDLFLSRNSNRVSDNPPLESNAGAQTSITANQSVAPQLNLGIFTVRENRSAYHDNRRSKKNHGCSLQ